jgi:hypothetical protein
MGGGDSRFLRCARNDNQKGKREGNSRFPSGMTTKKQKQKQKQRQEQKTKAKATADSLRE